MMIKIKMIQTKSQYVHKYIITLYFICTHYYNVSLRYFTSFFRILLTTGIGMPTISVYGIHGKKHEYKQNTSFTLEIFALTIRLTRLESTKNICNLIVLTLRNEP